MRPLSVVVLSILFACGEPSVAPQPVEQNAPAPAAEPSAAPAAPTTADAPHNPHATGAPSGDVRVGKVLEVLLVGDRYTYARMDACGQEAWVAGPSQALEVGLCPGAGIN